MSGSLPAGFTLDQAPATAPGLPEGFTLDPPPPQGVMPAAERGAGLGARDLIQGVFGGPYDLIAKGINATGVLPHINTMSENLTSAGLPSPATPTERFISSVQEPVAGVLGSVATGGLLSRAASPVARGIGNMLLTQPATQAIAAGAGGGVGEATDNPNLGLLTALAVPLARPGLGAIGRGAERLAMGDASAADGQLGQIARDKYNIPIDATDLQNNQMNRTMIDQAGKLPFAGARAAVAAKREAWQSAIANEMGENAQAFTPDVMSRADTRIGQTFDDVASRTTIPLAQSSRLLTDLAAITPQARQVIGPNEMAPLQGQIREIANLIGQNNGQISGDAYQALTRLGSPLSRLEKNPGAVGDFASDIRDKLDDAFQRSASPADQQALSQARYQYRVMRTIDPLVAGSRDGNITPDAFMQKALTSSRRFDAPTGGMAYTGGGNIGELARIGKLMRAAPDSGTGDRLMINAAAAGGIPALANISLPAAMGTAATLAANRGIGSYLRSNGLAERAIQNATGQAPVGQWNQALATSQLLALKGLASNRNSLLPDN